MVGIAETMITVILKVWFPKIVDETARKIRQDLKVIHGQGSTFFKDAVKC